MSFFRSFLAALSCIALFTPTATSQLHQGACLPDCYDQPFGDIVFPYAYFTLPGCPNCLVEVRYRTRTACPPLNYQDVFIERIMGNNIYGCVTDCFGGSLSDFIKALTEQLILSNPMGFKPETSGEPCADNWRVLKGSCWTMSSVPNVQVVPESPTLLQLAHPCSDWLCCLEKYTVCIVNNKRVITETLYIPPPEPMCPDDHNPHSPLDCVYVCGSVYRP